MGEISGVDGGGDHDFRLQTSYGLDCQFRQDNGDESPHIDDVLSEVAVWALLAVGDLQIGLRKAGHTEMPRKTYNIFMSLRLRWKPGRRSQQVAVEAVKRWPHDAEGPCQLRETGQSRCGEISTHPGGPNLRTHTLAGVVL